MERTTCANCGDDCLYHRGERNLCSKCEAKESGRPYQSPRGVLPGQDEDYPWGGYRGEEDYP